MLCRKHIKQDRPPFLSSVALSVLVRTDGPQDLNKDVLAYNLLKWLLVQLIQQKTVL